MFVCLCHGITDTQIKNIVRTQGVGNVRDLKSALGVGSQCGSCINMARDIIDATIVDDVMFKDVG